MVLYYSKGCAGIDTRWQLHSTEWGSMRIAPLCMEKIRNEINTTILTFNKKNKQIMRMKKLLMFVVLLCISIG
ncbi:MAG: hypothetical protein II453_13900, partial [Alphaproteobacteria bacterium]|nr:hypothetical protein [Alphaproteobacteria bacterium]